MTISNALVVHGGYSNVEIGLLQNTLLKDSIIIHKHQASRDILIALDALLNRNNLTLMDCTFIAAHQGPGPFTTLRVILASVNGLAFGTGLPLIGVDGLDAFVEEYKNKTATRYLAIILNAFSDDVYFAFYDTKTESLEKGCESINNFVMRLKAINHTQSSPLATCVGNAASLHRDILNFECGPMVTIPEQPQEIASLNAISDRAVILWFEKKTHPQLLPLYLKDSSAKLGAPLSL